MSILTRAALNAEAGVIQGEVNPKANSTERVGQILRDLADSHAMVGLPGAWVLRGRYPGVEGDSDPLVVSGSTGAQLTVPLFTGIGLPELANSIADVRVRIFAGKTSTCGFGVGLTTNPANYAALNGVSTLESVLIEATMSKRVLADRVAVEIRMTSSGTGVLSEVEQLPYGSMMRTGNLLQLCPPLYLWGYDAAPAFQIRWATLETRVGIGD